MSGTVKVLDPTTGTLTDAAPEQAEADYRAGKVQLPDTEAYALTGSDGKVAGYFRADKVGEALRNGFRFATKNEENAHIAEGQPVQAALEGFVNDVTLPGAYDLPASLLGADMDMVRARRETTAGQAGSYAGMAGSFLIPGVNLLTAESAAARVAGRVLPHAIAEAGVKAATEATEKALSGVLGPGMARAAIAHGVGAGAMGAGVGALGVLDEAALGNTEASVENLLTGAGAGMLIGAGLGGGIGAFVGRNAGKVDGRSAVGGAEAAREAELPGQLTADELTAALEATGQDVSAEGQRKWFPRLMAKLSSQATGADEADILRVMSPAGRKVVLEGERARERAVESFTGLLDGLEANTTRFNLDDARLNPTVLDTIPVGNEAAVIETSAAAIKEARSYITEQIRNAANYGKTKEQVAAQLKPLMTRLQEAEDRIVAEAGPAAEPKSWLDDAVDELDAPKGSTFKPRAAKRLKTGKETHELNTTKPAFISTDAINLTDLENGMLHGVDGASSSTNIAQLFPGRFLIETVPQGKIVKYAENSELPFRNGMEELRRVSASPLDVSGEHAAQTLMNSIHYDIPVEMEKLGMPKVLGGQIDSAADMAEQIHNHWVKQARVKALTGEVDDGVLKMLETDWKPAKIEEKLREAAHLTMLGYEGEREMMLLHQGGLQVPREGTTILDQATGLAYKRDDFVKAAREGKFNDALPVDGSTKKEGHVGIITEGASTPMNQFPAKVQEIIANSGGTKMTVEELWSQLPMLNKNRMVQVLKQMQKDGVVDLHHLRPSHGEKILDEEKHIKDFVVTLHGVDEGGAPGLWSQYAEGAKPKPGVVSAGMGKLESLAAGATPVKSTAAKKAFAELDQVWRLAEAQQKKLQPIISDTPGLKGLSDVLRSKLQAEDVWGPAAKAHRELTDSWDTLQKARTELNQELPFRNGKSSPELVRNWTKSLENVRGNDTVKRIANWVDAHGRMAETASRHLDGHQGYTKAGKDLIRGYEGTYKALRDDVMTLNAQDRLVRGDREHGTVPSFLAGAGLHALGLPGAAAFPAANAIMNPGRAAKTLASIAALKAKVMEDIGHRVGAVLGHAPSAARMEVQLPRVVDRMVNGSPSEREEAFVAHQEEMRSTVGDPTAYADHMVRELAPIAKAAPAHAQAMAGKGQLIASYLSVLQPEPRADLATVTEADPLDILRAASRKKSASLPAPAEIRNYGQLVGVATVGAPYMLDLIGKGQVRPSHVKAFREIYPHMDAELRTKLLEGLPSAKRVSPAAKRGLAVYLAAGERPDPVRLQQRQAVFAAEHEQADAASAAVKPAPTNPITVLSLPNDRIEYGARP